MREDGKIDLTLSGNTSERVATLADRILHYLELNHGSNPINDKSDPAEIEARFQCSKKDFKKAVGSLYKQHRILISPEGISLAKPE